MGSVVKKRRKRMARRSTQAAAQARVQRRKLGK